MREIKFRQWEPLYRVMIQWEPDPNGETEAHQQGLREAIKEYGWDELASASTFLQFTGLHDRNGKEIYEGDILHISPGLHPQYVRWVQWRAGFAMAISETSGTTGIPEDCEVIGNIYENGYPLGGTSDVG